MNEGREDRWVQEDLDVLCMQLAYDLCHLHSRSNFHVIPASLLPFRPLCVHPAHPSSVISWITFLALGKKGAQRTLGRVNVTKDMGILAEYLEIYICPGRHGVKGAGTPALLPQSAPQL